MKTIIVSVSLLTTAAAVLAAPPIPTTPAAVEQVVYARPFTLNDSFRFDWCSEAVQVSQGTILVLKVNPNLVIPRQIAEPVLYAGNRTAMRLNQGDKSGFVVAVVPGEVDLTKDPVWFGTPELPERVNAARIRAERQQAEKAGIKPLSTEQAKAALANGGGWINVQDMSALLRDTVSKLIEQYSPQEKELTVPWRMPVARTVAKP
jgi:hypothetical protein